jgi:hypothetical protein
MAQSGHEQLNANHRCVVEAFRAARPADFYGRRRYDRSQSDDPMSTYVAQDIEHHLSRGWQVDMERDQLATKGWLADCPQVWDA